MVALGSMLNHGRSYQEQNGGGDGKVEEEESLKEQLLREFR